METGKMSAKKPSPTPILMPRRGRSLGPLGRDREMWIIREWLEKEKCKLLLLKGRLELRKVLIDVLTQKLENELEKSLADPTYDWKAPGMGRVLDLEPSKV